MHQRGKRSMSAGATFSYQPHSTGSNDIASESSFSDSVGRLLDRIDYRLADSREQREAIFRLRYQAYLRERGILPNPSRSFSDSYDEMDNVCLFGVYIDDQLASSIRIHVVSKEHPACPSFEAFADILQPELDAGKVIVDTTRFVTDENLSRLHRGLPYATLRVSWLAAGYFGADHSLAAVRAEHQAFYRRTFHHRLICEPRPYPGLVKALCLMTIHYPTAADQVHRRFPFFRSTFFERRMLFERHQSASVQPAKPSQENMQPSVALDATRVAG